MTTNNSANITTPGLVALNTSGVMVTRTITGTPNQLAVANGDGISANPTLSFPATSVFTATQPMLVAYLGTPVTNVTGDGTTYTVLFDTVTTDSGSNYNTGTGTFTAPVTGNYMVSGLIRLSAVGTSTTFSALISSSPVLFFCDSNNIANLGANTSMYIPYTAMVRLTATQTIQIQVQANGGTKNNTVYGAASDYSTWLSVNLVN